MRFPRLSLLGYRLSWLIPALAATAATAAPLALTDSPLGVSTGVQPNVMLLIDNSGSMNNIVWAEGYDNRTEYAQWQRRTTNGWVTMTKTDGNISRSQLTRDTCQSGFRLFRDAANTTTQKCLRLPDPVGNNETRYAGNYLNYLLETYGHNSDLTDGRIPSQSLMQAAKAVSTDLVTNSSGMRFGISRFNAPVANGDVAPGGRVIAECGSNLATLTTAISGLSAETWTPLAESLYEVTRYFRGMSSHYNSGVSYTSPIQYRCQKNFTIVVTDGLPTYDATFPTDDPDDLADATRSLPNWDGLAPETSASDYPNFPQYSDGFDPSTSSSAEGHSLYLDDIAKFAWDIDFKKTGTDLAGGSYQDARFPKQNMHTYTVGFTAANQMLADAAEYGNGLYLTANNASELTEALRRALRDIEARSASSSSATANTGFLGASTKVYQARFNSSDWSGLLLAFAVNADPASPTYGSVLRNGNAAEGAVWEAGALIPGWNARNVFTRNGTGKRFRWDQLSEGQQANLPGGEAMLNYLRGDASNEQRNGGAWRNRATVLGDIVNSAPVFVGPPSHRYRDNLEAVTYSSFKTAHQNRPTMLYFGANDGMLHGISAENGQERMAYVPARLFGRLRHLTEPDYAHRYYADGSPTVIDAFIGGRWRTVLVAGLNRGGQGIYALDVTDPSAFTESDANAANVSLWEFTDANDADLGYTFSQPAIVKLQTGTWAAIFGNGYNNTEADGAASTTGEAALYIVNLQTGALIKKISTGAGMNADPSGQSRPNGLATIAAVDTNSDSRVDAVYAGDLFGNLWKFDLSGNNDAQWKIAYGSQNNPAPLFRACAAAACTQGTSTNVQPITTRPTVGRHPSGRGVMVYFGTGKYIETGDTSDTRTQSFYAIWDRDETVGGRSSLQQQSIAHELYGVHSGDNTFDLRVTTNNDVNWTNQRGWYLDLVSPVRGQQGERQVTNAVLRNDKIIFTTTIPNPDPCTPGGESWLMELAATTGSRLTYSPFDLNGDHQFTTADYVTVTVNGQEIRVPISGIRTEGGGAATPTVIATERGEVKIISSGAGLEAPPDENPGPKESGRQTWRELRR